MSITTLGHCTLVQARGCAPMRTPTGHVLAPRPGPGDSGGHCGSAASEALPTRRAVGEADALIYRAAIIMISTRYWGWASLAWMVARTGMLLGSTHLSHATFISSHLAMSAM